MHHNAVGRTSADPKEKISVGLQFDRINLQRGERHVQRPDICLPQKILRVGPHQRRAVRDVGLHFLDAVAKLHRRDVENRIGRARHRHAVGEPLDADRVRGGLHKIDAERERLGGIHGQIIRRRRAAVHRANFSINGQDQRLRIDGSETINAFQALHPRIQRGAIPASGVIMRPLE